VLQPEPQIIQSGIPDAWLEPLQVTKITGYSRERIQKFCDDNTFVSRTDPINRRVSISFFSVRKHMEYVNREHYAETERRKKANADRIRKERGK
jgi:hypothetical protein